MTKKILLINSDLAKNRGDRAITEGIVELITQRFPGARITGISQHPARDRSWYGTDFLDMNFQSLSLFDLIRLYRAAKQSDAVLWGGGEMLKDYTNKAALWYWVGKMTILSLANKNLYGAYQGIGPTSSPFSKKLIAFVVNRCRLFIVRDDESRDKLADWGVSPDKLVAASDPAVLPVPEPLSPNLKKKLQKDFSITDEFLSDFICIGLRDWFHYKPGGIIPFKYKRRLMRLLGMSTAYKESDQHKLYIKRLQELTRVITQELGQRILFVPMHLEENDTELSRQMSQFASSPHMTRVVSSDTLSPSEVRSLIGSAKAMVGFRLHSNIIGISAGTPSLNIYYVDKGRVFFDQINQQRYARPIESILEDDFIETFTSVFTELLKSSGKVRREINLATTKLRERVTSAFEGVQIND